MRLLSALALLPLVVLVGSCSRRTTTGSDRAALAPEAGPAERTYYVCDCAAGAADGCVAGTDDAAGTSPHQPKQTVEAARHLFNATLDAGQSLFFCRGGSFRLEGNRWVNPRCKAHAPCTVADYAAPWAKGSEERPLFVQPSVATAFDLSNPEEPAHEEGYVFKNLRIQAGSSGGWGLFIYNDVDDVLLDNVAIEGFSIGVHVAGANDATQGHDNARITLRNSQILDNATHGFLGGAKGLLLENNTFAHNGHAFGHASEQHHNVAISGIVPHTEDVVVRGNDLTRSAIDARGKCVGASLVAHGVIARLRIEANRVHEEPGVAEPGCFGIAVDPAYTTPEKFEDVVIRRNKVLNAGLVGIGTASCVRCTLEDNVVVFSAGAGYAIAAPDRERGLDDEPMSHVIVRNNAIYYGPGTLGGTAITLGGEGSGHEVSHNAIKYLGDATGSFTCANEDLPRSAYADVDHNACFFPNAIGITEWKSGAGTKPSPLAAARAAGFDLHSRMVDPAFDGGVDVPFESAR